MTRPPAPCSLAPGLTLPRRPAPRRLLITRPVSCGGREEQEDGEVQEFLLADGVYGEGAVSP